MNFAFVSIVLGIVLVAMHLPLVVAPAFVQRLAVGFPRNRWWGWALAGVDLVWAAYLLNQVPLGQVEWLKDYLLLLTPLAFVCVAVFADELLAARALGGLLVLVPAPLLDMARWHESGLRLVVVVVAYVMVVDGMALLLSPYGFRKTLQALAARRVFGWSVGLLGCALGATLVLLGIWVY